MTEWGVALIAAGAALAGSVVTGWFAMGAGGRQAEAARHAGDRQADAVLETVRATLHEQRTTRVLDLRRQTYVRFLEAAASAASTLRTGVADGPDQPSLERSLQAVLLEGPAHVAEAARELADRLERSRPLDDIEEAESAFLTAARQALGLGVAPPEG
ncbi:hypothetical protein [Streptomyces sp. NPDC002851]